MKETSAVVYISESDEIGEKVISLMDYHNVNYQIKNVTKDRDLMKELQKDGLFSTPTLFVEGSSKPILGYQEGKILQALGIMPN